MEVWIQDKLVKVIISKKKNKNTYLRVKEDLNIYVTTNYLMRDKDILKYLILKEGKETTRTLGAKYNVSYNCIHLKKKAIIRKLQKMVLNYRPNIMEELLDD